MTPLYHGGFGGLRVGDTVLPPTTTGAKSCADYGAGAVCRRDRVYLTPSYGAAMLFAVGHPSGRGKIYEVRADGELEADADCDQPGLSYAAPSAVVIRVHQISKRERETAMIALLDGTEKP